MAHVIKDTEESKKDGKRQIITSTKQGKTKEKNGFKSKFAKSKTSVKESLHKREERSKGEKKNQAKIGEKKEMKVIEKKRERQKNGQSLQKWDLKIHLFSCLFLFHFTGVQKEVKKKA